MIIEKRYLISILLLAFIISYVIVFRPFDYGDREVFNGKEIEWIDKPSFVLLKNLHSKNPVLRREAIIKLGEKRVRKALKPLFEILVSKVQPLYEKKLAAKSIALISSKNIIPVVLKAIAHYNSLPLDTVNRNRIIGMLYILNNINSPNINVKEYDFSVLESILKTNKDSEILKATLDAIGNLGYVNLFYDVAKLYANPFLKISCIETMRKLVLKNPRFKKWYVAFLTKVYKKERDCAVKAAINRALIFMKFGIELSGKNLYLIEKISSLSSGNIIEAIEAESFLLNSEISEENLDVLRFFLSSKDPLLKNRLLGVLEKKRTTFGLEDYLYKIIQEVNSVRPIEIAYDSAKKALSLLKYSEEVININFLTKLVYNYYLGPTAIETLCALIDKKVYTERIREVFAYFNYRLFQRKASLLPLLQIYLKLGMNRNIERLLLSGDPYLTTNTLIFLRSKNLIGDYKQIIDKISERNILIKRVLEL